MAISKDVYEAYQFGLLRFHQKAEKLQTAPSTPKKHQFGQAWYVQLMLSNFGNFRSNFEKSKSTVRSTIISAMRCRPGDAGSLVWDSSLKPSGKRAIIDQAFKCYNKEQYAEFVQSSSENGQDDAFFQYALNKAKDKRYILRFKA